MLCKRCLLLFRAKTNMCGRAVLSSTAVRAGVPFLFRVACLAACAAMEPLVGKACEFVCARSNCPASTLLLVMELASASDPCLGIASSKASMWGSRHLAFPPPPSKSRDAQNSPKVTRCMLTSYSQLLSFEACFCGWFCFSFFLKTFSDAARYFPC